MRRDQLEHVIRAAADIADDDEIVIVGSQAILGGHADAPAELLTSMDADVYPRNHPERAVVIDGAIGEGSPFHDTFGYYAHGVGPETAKAPRGWEDRLVEIRNANTRGVTGLCLEIHDVIASKCVAGRQKDWDFARAAVRYGLADIAELQRRVGALPVDDDAIATVERGLAGLR